MSAFNANSNPFFEKNLMLSLKLESDGKEAELPSGNIERLSLNLHSYGHTCNIQFCTFDDDDVDQIFTVPKVLKATLAFKPIDPADGSAPLLEIKGIVTNKCFKRIPSVLGKEEQAHRVYEIYFSDSAKVTWEQHYPINIYLEESMKDVIDKHINPEITMKYDWDPLETKYPITAFSLEHKYWLPAQEQTNFYSFLMWYLYQENGILAYDYETHGYTITGKKRKPLALLWTFTNGIPPLRFASFPTLHAIIQKTLNTLQIPWMEKIRKMTIPLNPLEGRP